MTIGTSRRDQVESFPNDLGSGSMMACFAEATDASLIFIDHTGAIAFVNRAAENLFGTKRQSLIGQPLDRLMPERLRAAHHAGVDRIQAGLPSRLGGRTVEVMALHADGHEFPIEISMSIWNGASGMVMGGMIRDISERRERDVRLAGLARRDPLTGLPNRVAMTERLQSILAAGSDASVIVIGLTGLKQINDDLGHEVGDTILQSLAIRLLTALGTDVALCRLEGSMFAVLVPHLADPVQVTQTANGLLGLINSPHNVGEYVVRLGAAAGVALGPSQAADAEELVASAELALIRSKDGSARLFETAMRSSAAARRAMSDEIKRAVEAKEFELYFQPQINLADGSIIGAEALLRWNHPTRGLRSPAAFIDALEPHSLSAQVGDWIIDEACRQVASWRRTVLPSARVSINLFAEQLRSGSLPQIVGSALDRHGLPPESVELEVTETTALQASTELDSAFCELRRARIRIAFDDFGTGHASLSLLKTFPITTLKIDRAFIRDIQTDRFDEAIVKALLDMSRSMGLDVVAEGIETPEQEKILVKLGCRYGQGYHYARPLPASKFIDFVTERGNPVSKTRFA